MYTLYVIPGSHACRSAMLMLEHKGVPYRRVDFVTLTHPIAARLRGFNASPERRMVGSRSPLPVKSGDLLGTVPSLAAGDERISSNRSIARFLDERHPERPLLPADAERRRAVEEAERWANDKLQMVARRLTLAAGLKDPTAFARLGADGRMGYLLYRRPRARRIFMPLIARLWAVHPAAEQALLEKLPGMLDRIDGWIDEGVLGGEELNAADFMVAPSLALMLYRPELRPFFEGRPALELVDRILPEPSAARTARA
jgi:glutathione S-transferase